MQNCLREKKLCRKGWAEHKGMHNVGGQTFLRQYHLLASRRASALPARRIPFPRARRVYKKNKLFRKVARYSDRCSRSGPRLTTDMQNASNNTKIATQLAGDRMPAPLPGRSAQPALHPPPPAGYDGRAQGMSPCAKSHPSLSLCSLSPWQASGTPKTTAARRQQACPGSFHGRHPRA